MPRACPHARQDKAGYGIQENNFPFSVLHFSFVIAHSCASSMTNDKRHMENGKWFGFSANNHS
jgi:hypothetical protein